MAKDLVEKESKDTDKKLVEIDELKTVRENIEKELYDTRATKDSLEAQNASLRKQLEERKSQFEHEKNREREGLEKEYQKKNKEIKNIKDKAAKELEGIEIRKLELEKEETKVGAIKEQAKSFAADKRNLERRRMEAEELMAKAQNIYEETKLEKEKYATDLADLQKREKALEEKEAWVKEQNTIIQNKQKELKEDTDYYKKIKAEVEEKLKGGSHG